MLREGSLIQLRNIWYHQSLEEGMIGVKFYL